MTVDYQKVWRTMNDLEQVISKVVSAREMIDIANECCSTNQQERAETMTMAAYEFLGYFIEEFDEKFKLAWQATVGDLRNGDVRSSFSCDKDDSSPECKGAWTSFWEENYYPEEHQQYTEDELNAMCDEAASDQDKEQCREYNLREAEYYDKRVKLDVEIEEIRKAGGYEWTPETKKTLSYDEAVTAGWTMTDDGFWMPPQNKKKWVLPVEECKDVDTDKIDYFVTFPDDLLEAANLKEGDEMNWVDNGDGSYTIHKVSKLLEPDEC